MKAYSKPIETERVYIEETPGVVLHMSREEADAVQGVLSYFATDEEFRGVFQREVERTAIVTAEALRSVLNGRARDCAEVPMPFVYDGRKRLDVRDPCAQFDRNYWRWDKGCCKWVRR